MRILLLLIASVLAKPIDYKAITKDEWKKKLTPEEFRVCRERGTEPPHEGALTQNKETGVYSCALCGQELFSSKTKFESGTGWPSFYEPIKKENVGTRDDNEFGMVRTEVVCSRCGAHLGHVFDDGPKPTGKRYCINSVCLKFTPEKAPSKKSKP